LSCLLKAPPERLALRDHLSSDTATGKLYHRDNGHVIVITDCRRLGNTSDLDMIVVSPLAEVIEEVRHRRLCCQRLHLVVKSKRPLVIIGAVQVSYPEHRYLMTCHYDSDYFITLAR